MSPVLSNTAKRFASKDTLRPFLILFISGVLINLPLITQRLTNNLDGLWNQDDYLAGSWELSTGRWFWIILDRLRFGISLDPFQTLAALALFAAGLLLASRVLSLSRSPLTLLAGIWFLAGVGVTCQLSFSFMAITYGVSFLLSILAVFLITTKAPLPLPLRIGCSSLSIAFMMGCYQASIGVTALLALSVLLYGILRNKTIRSQLSFALRMVAAVLFGAVLYMVLLKVSLHLTGTELSDYQGFSNLSVSYLMSALPSAFVHCYRTAAHYLLDGTFRSNRLIGHAWFPVFYLPILLPGICGILRTVKRSIPRALFLVLGILLFPAAANCFYFVAPETETHMQMMIPMGCVLPLLLCMADPLWTKQKADKVQDSVCHTPTAMGAFAIPAQGASGARLTCICLITAAFLCFGSLLQCVTDQYAMLVGRRATQTLAEEILAEASRLGYDYANGQILITDSPHSSKTFYTADLYDKANSYAQYGNWSHDLSFSRVSWIKFYANYLRIQVSFASGDTEATIAALPEVAAMPSFPAAGSVQNIYGVLVVKLGE